MCAPCMRKVKRNITFDVREFEINEEFLPQVVEASERLGDSTREFLTLLSSYLSEINFSGRKLVLRGEVESALIDVSADRIGRMRVLIFGNPDRALILVARLDIGGRTLWSGKIVRDEEDVDKAIDYFAEGFGVTERGITRLTLSVARSTIKRVLG